MIKYCPYQVLSVQSTSEIFWPMACYELVLKTSRLESTIKKRSSHVITSVYFFVQHEGCLFIFSTGEGCLLWHGDMRLYVVVGD
jgi:hypothetical protein